MKRSVPEGHTVKYEYDEVQQTGAGRLLLQPHRRTIAHVLDADDVEVATGSAICRSGPAYDEMDNYVVKLDDTVRVTKGSYDQFAKQIGRDIALGRALKLLEVMQT